MSKLNKKKHDLEDYIEEIQSSLESEYNRISRNSKDDPGTAGDEGEENWAKIIRDWIPKYYHVITKGQIIFSNGDLSPQVDIIILSPEYPQFLLSKKKYLASEVLAVFECKLTLRASHFKKIFENSEKIKSHYLNTGTGVINSVKSPFIYGVLAHSHEWDSPKSKPRENIEKNIKSNYQYCSASNAPDIFCINNQFIWSYGWLASPKLNSHNNGEKFIKRISSANKENQIDITTQYYCQDWTDGETKSGNPIGYLLVDLFHRLSKSNEQLAKLANYFSHTNVHARGGHGLVLEKIESNIFGSEVVLFLKQKAISLQNKGLLGVFSI